jgi:hypothetical protein
MDIQRPTEAELAALLAEHAHRFPEKARFTVADGDADVKLPVLLGNPSGACKMPGSLVSPAWDATAAATFKMRPDSEAVTEQLVADCVLWPNGETWLIWVQRWPALPEVVHAAVRQKTGARVAMLVEPKPGETCPDALVPALARVHGAVWRHLKPPGGEFTAAISPPDSGAWRMFGDAMKRRDAEHAQLARDLAESCLLATVGSDGLVVKAADIFDRWPGMVLLVGLIVAHLAGLTASYELGEW